MDGIDDIKIALLDKEEGSIVRVKIKRKKFLGGWRDVEFELTL